MIQPAEAKGLNIRTEFAEDLPQIVQTDTLRIRQVLLNLLSNAVKFSEKGSILVRVMLAKSKKEIMIFVKDEGIGISEAEQKLLFKPFSQVHPKGNQSYKGTGLGLYLSKRLGEALGGSVEYVSGSTGMGSEFCFTFVSHLKNNEQSDVMPATYSTKTSYVHSVPAKPIDILLVEDNLDAQSLMIQVLQKIPDANVLIANNGKEGVEKALALKPAIILMDIQLPILNGLDAVKQLRSLGFVYPIVALTANVTVGQRQKSLDAGCNEYLAKPVDQNLLIQTIIKLIS